MDEVQLAVAGEHDDGAEPAVGQQRDRLAHGSLDEVARRTWASKASTPKGRCGPWCSRVPIGTQAIGAADELLDLGDVQPLVTPLDPLA